MILDRHLARPLKVAVVDDHTPFVATAIEVLERIERVEAWAASAEEIVDWGAEIVIVDLRAGARLLIGPLKDRGIDVIVAASQPELSVIEGCPVYDKDRPSTALVALVEAIRRRRTPTD